MATYAMEKVANATLFDWLTSPSEGMFKRAEDAINAFTRLRVREDGIHRRVQTYLDLPNDELDRDYQEKPIKWVDMEPNSPGAVSVPFANLPSNVYIHGQRYRVLFNRIMTVNFTKDVDELRTYEMDLRQVLSDNSIKDMLEEEDTKFDRACTTAMGGTADVASTISGDLQWRGISGGVSRDGTREAFKILPSGLTHLEVKTCVMNNVTLQDVMKWGRDEVGGDFSQDMLKSGYKEETFQDAKLIVTIKRNLVPDGRLNMFPDEKFVGKAFVLDDTTMAVERKFFFINWFAYETVGAAIGNAASPTRADLT
jgi:hypothetical protein